MDLTVNATTIQQIVAADVVNATTLMSLTPVDRDKLAQELLLMLKTSLDKVPVDVLPDEKKRQIASAGGELAKAPKESQAHDWDEKVKGFTGLLRSSFGDVADVILTAVKLYNTVSGPFAGNS
jgi:hypothetical protein